MKLRRVRQDFDHLTSWVLLVVAGGTIVTGLIVHLWDLHGFVWHTWFGYAMTVAVLVHVCLNFRQLTAYAGFRLRQGWRAVTKAPRPPPRQKVAAAPAPRTAGATARAVLLSRRGLAGLALGGAGGYLLGQSLKSTPQLEAGSDLGLVYHRWSSDPGVVDAVGALRNLGRQPPLYKSYGDTVPVALSRPSLSGRLVHRTGDPAPALHSGVRAAIHDGAGTLARSRAHRRAHGTVVEPRERVSPRRPPQPPVVRGALSRSRHTRWCTTSPASRRASTTTAWNTMCCIRFGPGTTGSTWSSTG